MAELPRQSYGACNGSRAYAVQAHGWRAIALAALYPLRFLAQSTTRSEEGSAT